MGDNQPKKPQSFFEKIRAAVTTLRRPTTVPRQPGNLPVYSMTIAMGSGSVVVPGVDSTSVNLYGESSCATSTTVSTQGESKKTKRSKQARSKKNERHSHKSRDGSEESTPPEAQQIEILAGPSAATPADQEDTNTTDISETAESDNYSTAKSTQSRLSVLCNGQNTQRKVRRQKQADQLGNNMAKGHHGNTHTHGKVSSPATRSHDKGQGKSTSQKINNTTPHANVLASPLVEGRTEEIVNRPGTSHSALVKIFLANPLTQTDCASVPVYLELPEPEQSASKTQTARVATVSVDQQSTLHETHCNNKLPRSGTKRENSTKTSKDNKKCTSSKGNTSSRGTANNIPARGSPQPHSSRRSTKPLSPSKKTDTLFKPPVPTAKQVIFHKMPPTIRSVPEPKQRDSTDRPNTTNYQPTGKSKTEEQSSGNGLGSIQTMSSANNQDSVGYKDNVSTGSHLQVRPQTCNVSRKSRTRDKSPLKHDNAVSSTDRSRSHASNGCSSQLRPQTTHNGRNSRTHTVSPANRSKSNASNGCCSPLRPHASQDIKNLRTQETSRSKHDHIISSTDQSRSNTLNGCSSPLRPQAPRCCSNSRSYLASQSKLNKMISPTNRSRSSTTDRHNSQLQSRTFGTSNSSSPYLASQPQSNLQRTISPTNQSRSNASDSCNSPPQPDASGASSSTRVFLAPQLKLHKTTSPTDISRSNNVLDGCESQLRPHTGRCSSNSRVYLGSQSKLDPIFSQTVRRPNTTPGNVLNETQFPEDLKSNSSILSTTITNILPSGNTEHESSSRVADTLENCPVSFTITVPSEHYWLKNGQHTSSQEIQGNSNLKLFDRPSTSKRYSNTEVNARPKNLPSKIRPTTSFPFTKVDKLRRITQDENPASNVKIITVPLIREKTYLILPSPKVSGNNDDAHKAILPKSKCPLLTRQNTFLILPSPDNNYPISKRKSLNKISSSTPLVKRHRSHGEVSKIASDKLVTNTSSAIPLAKGNTYLIIPGTSASRDKGHDDNFVIPLMKKSTYLVLPSKKHSSEIKIHRSCGTIPLIRSSTYEIIKSKRIFSMP